MLVERALQLRREQAERAEVAVVRLVHDADTEQHRVQSTVVENTVRDGGDETVEKGCVLVEHAEQMLRHPCA